MVWGAAECSLGQPVIFLKGLQVEKNRSEKGINNINYIYTDIHHMPNPLQVLDFKVRGLQLVSL